MGADRRRHVDPVTLQDGQGVRRARVLSDRRAGGDHRRVVARHVRDQQADDPRRMGRRRQPPALDGREVLTDDVHLADIGARGQQRLVDRLFLGQRDGARRQGQQRRAAARNQGNHQIVLGQAL